MDILDGVRDLRSDPPGPTDAETAAASEVLERAIAAESRVPRPARRRRGFAWAGVLTGSAVIAALALVVASVGGIGPVSRSGHHVGIAVPPATAAEVLTRAANLAGKSVPAQPGPGQYLRVETDSAQLETWHTTPDLIGRKSSTASWIRHSEDVVYVPFDQSSIWILDNSATPATINDKNGTNVDAAIAGWQALNPGFDTPSVRYLRGGLMDSGANDHHPVRYGSLTGDPSAVPTDPAKLLAWLPSQLFPNGAKVDDVFYESEFDAIVAALQANVAPSALRATMFRALALIPGVTLVGTSGTTSTLQFAGHDIDRITVDTATGLLAHRMMFFEPDGVDQRIGAVPAGTPDVSTTVKTTVVDELPPKLQAGLSGNGK